MADNFIECTKGDKGDKGEKDEKNSVENMLNIKIQSIIDILNGKLNFSERLIEGKTFENKMIIKKFTDEVDKFLQNDAILLHAYYIFLVDVKLYILSNK